MRQLLVIVDPSYYSVELAGPCSCCSEVIQRKTERLRIHVKRALIDFAQGAGVVTVTVHRWCAVIRLCVGVRE